MLEQVLTVDAFEKMVEELERECYLAEQKQAIQVSTNPAAPSLLNYITIAMLTDAHNPLTPSTPTASVTPPPCSRRGASLQAGSRHCVVSTSGSCCGMRRAVQEVLLRRHRRVQAGVQLGPRQVLVLEASVKVCACVWVSTPIAM